MFNIEDYYLGVIIAAPSYYTNPKKVRYLGEYSFDPFEDLPQWVAMTAGVVTLLHKIEGKYYDEYYSRYPNELSYEENNTNKLGITLAFVKPFKDYYEEDPIIYEQVELEEYQKMEEVFNNHSYYVTHYKESKNYAIVQLDTEPMKLVAKDYVHKQLENSGIAYQKRKN